MKYYIIAGEASGDLHGSNLIKQIRSKDHESVIRAWGGDEMQQAGADIVKHYRDLAFMGFLEVAMNLTTILKNIKFCKEDILGFEPDVLVLIDYPGFNMRIAEWAKNKGIKVVYYISPQVWAWKKGRVHKLKRDVDRMMVILPFEPEFYRGYQMEVDYVGHPLLDAIEQLSEERKALPQEVDNGKKIIALLPGSRKQEITSMLSEMLKMVNEFPDYQFVVAGAPSQTKAFYKEIMGSSNIPVLFDKTYALLSHAHAALVTSGTATLETALFEVPEVVCYKGNPISFAIAKQLVDIKFISLVNLIVDKELVKELIQGDLNKKQLKRELEKCLDVNHREALIGEYRKMKEKLGSGGASAKAAEIVVQEARG
ncbi:MAG: lipid-A-disaccharide synthase [Schleiferiaceae bacterium]|nr:lipid-A-disaccharide synthase [Schleiferiaceae bacterium]